MEQSDRQPYEYPLDIDALGFAEAARKAVYQVIYQRRDVRNFRPDPIPDDKLARIVRAAHHGPSVGFMQPWDFILVHDLEKRQRMKELFERERAAAACFFDEPRRSEYLALKLEGILDAPVNLCVTCDPTRADVVLGRNSMPETDVYSTCCAIQNLWLAARSEGIGVGWVSILKLPQLRGILGIPPHIVPVAYLCLGYPTEFAAEPGLQTAGWRRRLPLKQLVHLDGWGNSAPDRQWQGLWDALDGEIP